MVKDYQKQPAPLERTTRRTLTGSQSENPERVIRDKDDDSHPEPFASRHSEGAKRPKNPAQGKLREGSQRFFATAQNDCGQLSNGLRSPENLRLHQLNDMLENNYPSDAQAIKKSLETARLIIEDKCQKPIKHLALPYHKGNPLIYQAAKESGYLTIFDSLSSAKGGYIFTGDIFHISRFQIRWAMMLPGKGRLTITKKVINTLLGRRLSIEE